MPSDIIKTEIDGLITLRDGGSGESRLSLTVAFSGNFSLKGLSEQNMDVSEYFRRGQLVGVRHKQRSIPTLSFDALLAEYTDDSEGTLLDAIRRKGAWRNAISSRGSGHEVYTLEVEFRISGAEHDEEDHIALCKHVRLVADDLTEGDPNQVSASGRVYIFADDDVELT